MKSDKKKFDLDQEKSLIKKIQLCKDSMSPQILKLKINNLKQINKSLSKNNY